PPLPAFPRHLRLLLLSPPREWSMTRSSRATVAGSPLNRTARENLRLGLLIPTGPTPFQLTSMGAQDTGTPSWSPDGQFIAFDSNLEGQPEIYVIPASGGKPRLLTFNPANDMIPSFSRDGQWIYFTSNRTGDYQI